MGFINEEIQEKDKEKFNSFHLVGEYTGTHLKPWMWTVDRDREIYLIATEKGRDRDHPNYYAFIWKRKKIRIEAYIKKKPVPELHWNLSSIHIPMSLKGEQEMIYKAILEAFKVFGYLYSDEDPELIFFDHVNNPSYIGG